MIACLSRGRRGRDPRYLDEQAKLLSGVKGEISPISQEPGAAGAKWWTVKGAWDRRRDRDIDGMARGRSDGVGAGVPEPAGGGWRGTGGDLE